MRVLSGIQPSGRLHLGNYLGAIRQFLELQQRAECLFCVVDLHSLTVPQDPAELRQRTLEVAALYLAAGIDPRRATVFVQSHVPEHTELGWLLGCVATFGELQRMTQFKDKASGRDSVSLGLFAYPVLMAADILLYRATHVPVGDDQRQHLELTRDVAGRFNARFGDTFPQPEALIGGVGARVMSLQDPEEKMSKSAADPTGRIELLDPPDTIRAKLRRAVTDSEREIRHDRARKPAVSNLLEILALVSETSLAELEEQYAGAGYGKLKQDLAEAVVALLEPLQARHRELLQAPDHLTAVLRAGGESARTLAAATMAAVRDRVGLLPTAR
jgi:tryptophanyl-tRNA synthetase